MCKALKVNNDAEKWYNQFHTKSRIDGLLSDFKGNPYKEAGVKAGDEVFMINDILYKDVNYEDALKFQGETIRWVFLRDREQIIVIKPFDENYDMIID